MDKKITAKIVGTGNPEVKDLKIKKGTTVADLKRGLDVPQSFQVFRRQTNEFLNDGQDLFGLLEEHEKLEISPESELGWLRERISSLFYSINNGKIEIISTVPLNVIEIAPSQLSNLPQSTYQPQTYYQSQPVIRRPTFDIKPAESIGLSAEMANIGWIPTDQGYEGAYTDRNGKTYLGKIVRGWKNQNEYYIKDPPEMIFFGRHGGCFSACGKGWYHIHFARGKRNHLVALIQRVQEYINEIGVSI